MKVTLSINEEDYTKYLPLPIKWSSLLDERLDEGRLSLRQCPASLFSPLSECVIGVSEDGEESTKTFLVSADESTEAPAGSGLYNHEIMLIEETKKLEGIIIDSLTFTNSLGRTYTDAAVTSPIKVETETSALAIDHYNEPYLTPVQQAESFSVFGTRSVAVLNSDSKEYFPSFDGSKITLIAPNGDETTVSESADGAAGGVTIELPQVGTYILRYSGRILISSDKVRPYHENYSFSFQIDSVKNQGPLPKWTIADVIERLLDVGQVHLSSESPEFSLNTEQKDEFSKIEAPEFAFSQMTLREALDQVGGFIHGMARLKGNTIYYDMIGDTETAELSKLKYPYISNKYTQNIESYATELDSTVDNLVTALDSDEAALSEPCGNWYKSIRSEEAYARITDGNMVIATTLPIYSIQQVEFRVYDDDTNEYKTGDITDYIFESAEYGLMSSFRGIYPFSKDWAIYYEQGKNNIKGLSYKTPNVIGGALSQYAITNIIKQVSGYDIADNFWEAGNYPELAFRVVYTPIFSSRVKQHKFRYSDYKYPRTLTYNQGANLVESRFYGENMRGMIARTGNPEITRTYRLNSLALLPAVGKMWNNDFFVSEVTVSVMPFYVECMVGLSKDFNRWSEYVGINSMRRAYEVSEKQAYDRNISYSDYCIIGMGVSSDNKNLVSEDGVNAIASTFEQKFEHKSISAALVTTLDEDQQKIAELTMPVVSTAMGNTLVFSFYMQDNYSAGYKSVYNDYYKNVKGYWQTNIAYNDYYGRFEYMKFSLVENGITNFIFDSPFRLPEGIYSTENGRITTKDEDPLKIRKNGTEVIKMHYQLHFVTNRNDIIIGPAMTHNCPLVGGTRSGHSAALYALDTKIGKFDRKIDMSNSTLIHNFAEGGVNVANMNQINFDDIRATTNGVAWAIADSNTGELLFGSNLQFYIGQSLYLPTLTFKHNLYTEE